MDTIIKKINFQNYSQSNCEMECYTNFTKKECGCVKFSMPSKQLYYMKLQFNCFRLLKLSNIFNPIGDNTTEVCGSSKIKCWEEAFKTFWQNEKTVDSIPNNNQKLCGCLPSCTTIE